jgi:FkbM family methyltransferase
VIIDPAKTMRHIGDVNGVLHIGAHEAQELDFYRKYFGEVPIMWVEADHEVMPRLMKATAGDDRSVVVNMAIGEVVGYATFHRANMDQSSSLLELGTHAFVHPEVNYVDESTVWVNTLAYLVKECKLEGYNFLNMDVQGAEGMVIKGGLHYLRNHVDYIYTEVNRDELYVGCMMLPEMDEILGDLGFSRRESVVYESLGWGDALYVRDS